MRSGRSIYKILSRPLQRFPKNQDTAPGAQTLAERFPPGASGPWDGGAVMTLLPHVGLFTRAQIGQWQAAGYICEREKTAQQPGTTPGRGLRSLVQPNSSSAERRAAPEAPLVRRVAGNCELKGEVFGGVGELSAENNFCFHPCRRLGVWSPTSPFPPWPGFSYLWRNALDAGLLSFPLSLRCSCDNPPPAPRPLLPTQAPIGLGFSVDAILIGFHHFLREKWEGGWFVVETDLTAPGKAGHSFTL